MTNRKPLQEQAYEVMKEMIFNGELEPGVIYSESKTAAQLGISRTPLKSALVYLSQDKYVDILPSKGFCLHVLTKRDLLETYHLRGALEGYSAREIAKDVAGEKGRECLAKLQQMLDQMQQIFNSSKDFKAFTQIDHAFHAMLVSYAGSEEFNQIFAHHMYRISKFAIDSFSKSGRMAQAIGEHNDILVAIRSANLEATYSAVLKHIHALTSMTVPNLKY